MNNKFRNRFLPFVTSVIAMSLGAVPLMVLIPISFTPHISFLAMTPKQG